jgi:hypothetical protein
MRNRMHSPTIKITPRWVNKVLQYQWMAGVPGELASSYDDFIKSDGTTECTSDSPPLARCPGYLPIPFHVTKTDWQKLVLKCKSETPGIKLPWQLPHCLSTVKTLFKNFIPVSSILLRINTNNYKWISAIATQYFTFILILHHHSTFPSNDMFRPTGPSSGEFTNAKILHTTRRLIKDTNSITVGYLINFTKVNLACK